ncbi:Crp/Fnr family transcriptional regulator [Chitinophaga cymbidii]|uniref:Crp/Fnr family transcriptional regulator n=1 Tax=Chitinophaga cymbidii TaxID=1096750 RepID=A0A512RH73_9BACT|nr:Crp/Fnr family transcriptional regulator [Chitinophaga cymbidii]GEP95040.1 Crp/Fnr family transcriptional regulator [Chitinophaga cymbidii]
MSSDHTACRYCGKYLSDIFSVSAPEHAEAIAHVKQCNLYKKGQVIFQEGAHPYGIYCINTGKVKLSHSGDEGRDQIIRLVKPGDLIGYKALISNEPYTATATVLEDSAVCFIPRDVFLQVLQKDTALSLRMMQILTSELRRAETKITHLAQKPVRERLAETLLTLKETYGLEEDEQTINVTLSREEIANLVGTATESAIRLLSEFKKEKVIDLPGKKIRILRLQQLIKMANLQD